MSISLETNVRANLNFIIEYVADSVEYYSDRFQESGYPDSVHTEWRELLSANKKGTEKAENV